MKNILSSSWWKKIHAVLFFLILGIVPFGQLERLELSTTRALYIHEIGIVVFIGMALLLYGKKIFSFGKRLPFISSFLLFIAWILLSFIWGTYADFSQTATAFLYLSRFLLYSIFSFLTLFLLSQKELKIPQVKTSVLLSVGLIAIFGWVQYLLVPDTRFLIYAGWDRHYLRLISTLFDPNFTGILLSIGALLLHKKMGESSLSLREKILLFLFISALLFTYSRASFLAYGVGIIWLIVSQKKIIHALFLFLFALGIVFLPRQNSEGTRLERTASVTARIDSVGSSLQSLNIKDIVLGKGWYSYKTIAVSPVFDLEVPNHASAPDNSLIFLFTSVGLIGSALFGLCGWKVVSFVGWKSDLVLVLGAVLVHSLFNNTLFYAFVLFYVAVIMGYTVASTLLLPRSRPYSQL
jgi:hypothetical protein